MNPLLPEPGRAWRPTKTAVLTPILDRVGLADRPRDRGADGVDVEGGLHQGGLIPDREPAVLVACSADPPRHITQSLHSALLPTAGRCHGPIIRTKER